MRAMASSFLFNSSCGSIQTALRADSASRMTISFLTACLPVRYTLIIGFYKIFSQSVFTRFLRFLVANDVREGCRDAIKVDITSENNVIVVFVIIIVQHIIR